MDRDYVRYNIECPKNLWKSFRQVLSKDDIINSVIIILIKDFTEKRNKKEKVFKE